MPQLSTCCTERSTSIDATPLAWRTRAHAHGDKTPAPVGRGRAGAEGRGARVLANAGDVATNNLAPEEGLTAETRRAPAAGQQQ